MKKILLILSLTLLLFSCKTRHEVIQYVTKTDTFMLTIRERIRDTIKFSAPDTATFEALLKCDSLNNAYFQQITTKTGKHTQIIFSLKYDTIRLSAIVDSFAVYLKWKEKDSIIGVIKQTNIETIIREPIKNHSSWPKWVVISALFIVLLLIGMIKQVFK